MVCTKSPPLNQPITTPKAARRHYGGGAVSGKDSTKVDRSAAYAAHYLAKNVVADLADRCTIHTHGTVQVPEEKLEATLFNEMSLSPRGISEYLKLNRQIYARIAAYGISAARRTPRVVFPGKTLIWRTI